MTSASGNGKAEQEFERTIKGLPIPKTPEWYVGKSIKLSFSESQLMHYRTRNQGISLYRRDLLDRITSNPLDLEPGHAVPDINR